MEATYEAKYHALEETLWWFLGRRDLLFSLLKNAPRDSKILEVGCAGGYFLRGLTDQGFSDVWGIDISAEAIKIARGRGLDRVAVADAAHLPLTDGSCDVVISSDVLEHIAEDAAALAEWSRVLKPGGRLFLFVPAHPFLWSPHDVANQHLRRYTRAGIAVLVRQAGFRVERSSYWNVLMFFPIAAVRLVMHVLPSRAMSTHQLHNLPACINVCIARVLHLENYFIARGWHAPVGVSLLLLARKDIKSA